jgi:hypothetical protein
MESNAATLGWKCMSEAERRFYITATIDHARPHDVVRQSGDRVLERRTGRKGTIDFRDAKMATLDGENATLIVPIYWGGWDWSALVWNYRGEFDRYVGLRKL